MRASNRLKWFIPLAMAAPLLVMSVTPTTASVRSQALYARGLVPFHRGFWEQAFRLFDEAVKADRNDAAALYYRGLTQARRGSKGAAVTDIKKALDIDPTLEHAALDLGVAYLDQGDVEQARQWLDRAYRQGTDKLNAALFLGVAQYRAGEYVAAIQYLEEAKADPELRQAALYYGGLALLKLGRAPQAYAVLAEASRENPGSEMGKAASKFAAGETPAEAEAAASGRPLSRPYSIVTDLHFEYDSNVTRGPSDGPKSTRDEADGRTVIGAGGRVTALQTETGELAPSAYVSQSVHFSQSDFDLSAIRLRLDWNDTPSWWGYGVSGGYDYNALDFKSFYQDVLLSPWLSVYETTETATQVYYRFRYRDFLHEPFDPFRDGFNNAVGVRQYYLFPDGVTLLHGGYQFDAESPEDVSDGNLVLESGAKDFEYLGQQIDLQLSSRFELPTLGAFDAAAGYRFRFDGYSNDNSRSRATTPPDPEKREDVTNLFAFTLGRDLNGDIDALGRVTQRTLISMSLIADIGSSNLDEFEYDRIIGSFGVRAEF